MSKSLKNKESPQDVTILLEESVLTVFRVVNKRKKTIQSKKSQEINVTMVQQENVLTVQQLK